MIELCIYASGLIAMFIFGVIIGWTQRDSDKQRDAQTLGDHIYKQCSQPSLRRAK